MGGILTSQHGHGVAGQSGPSYNGRARLSEYCHDRANIPQDVIRGEGNRGALRTKGCCTMYHNRSDHGIGDSAN